MKILIFFGTSKIKTTLKTSFSSRPIIFLYLDSPNGVGVRGAKESFSYKKVETSAIFWYLIGNCHTSKGLLISIKKVLVASKGKIPDSKSWAKSKKSSVDKKWFSMLSLLTR